MSFNFMAAVTICSGFGVQENKSVTVSPSICHEVMGLDAMIFVFGMFSPHLLPKMVLGAQNRLKTKIPCVIIPTHSEAITCVLSQSHHCFLLTASLSHSAVSAVRAGGPSLDYLQPNFHYLVSSIQLNMC